MSLKIKRRLKFITFAFCAAIIAGYRSLLMKNRLSGFCLLSLLLALSLWATAAEWPQWRGPELNGTSPEKNLPLKWSDQENIAWKIPVTGRSGATPIVWGDYVFLMSADSDFIGNLEVWCIDRNKGEILWKRPLGGGNRRVNKANMISNSPVTDGKTVWVLTGTGILKAFDFKGTELWNRDIQQDYGRFGQNWGYASSPLLYDDSLYVQVLQGMRTQDPSYILRIENRTGKTLWRVERPSPAKGESPDAYTTPQIYKDAGHTELIITGGDVITGHDLATGKELWRRTGFNPTGRLDNRVIASALVYQGIVYAPTRVKPLLAFQLSDRPDGESPKEIFAFDHGPDVPTPVCDGKLLYSVNDQGIIWALDAKTGADVYGGQRLKSATYSASPVLADGRLYITSEDGLTSVVKAGPQFELLAENQLNGYTLSSPAVSEGQIFIRTDKFLYAIGKRAVTADSKPSGRKRN
jgi:outer membrane protein assembly factor BamB